MKPNRLSTSLSKTVFTPKFFRATKRINISSHQKIIFIVGPTGAGKTDAAFALAGKVSSRLISADAMQIYRGMDIITDKPPRAILKKNPVRMIDVISPAREYNVAAYVRGARRWILSALKVRKLPIVVGGTGLYVSALLDGIFEGKSEDPRVRERLNKECEQKGASVLYERLKSIDPEAAAKIIPGHTRRIVRALEVYEVTRQPISVLQKKRAGLRGFYDVRVFGLERGRDDLYSRIDQRVDAMIGNGLLDEARGLLKKRLSKTAYCCIGVREIEGFLKGQYDLDEAVRLIKINSRHYAKRQMTWFRRDKSITWLNIGKGTDLSSVAEQIVEKIV
jgi:tRNA dimethylallyltransferase